MVGDIAGMTPVSGLGLYLDRGALRAVRVANFILRPAMLAGATFIQLAVAARQALAFRRVGRVVRRSIRRDFAGALLIGFGARLVTSFLVVRFSVGDACRCKECGCEHDVFHS